MYFGLRVARIQKELHSAALVTAINRSVSRSRGSDASLLWQQGCWGQDVARMEGAVIIGQKTHV